MNASDESGTVMPRSAPLPAGRTTHPMQVMTNYDYAAIKVGDTELYYGYQRKDAAGNWCFEARVGARCVARISQAELAKATRMNEESAVEYLLAGIGLMLQRGELTVTAPGADQRTK
jgi:hypothetical protein